MGEKMNREIITLLLGLLGLVLIGWGILWALPRDRIYKVFGLTIFWGIPRNKPVRRCLYCGDYFADKDPDKIVCWDCRGNYEMEEDG